MAEAFFDRLAQGKGEALSAGTSPAPGVDSTVVAVMKEIGIGLEGKIPKALTPAMLDGADRVITMGCGVEGVCPATFTETEDWGLPDPKGQSVDKVREIRDDIEKRVAEMLSKMEVNT